jgi:hypothetical protein
MFDFDGVEKAVLGLALLGPGFLILFGRSRFHTGRMVGVAESIFEYLMMSSVYFSFAYPLFSLISMPGYLSLLSFLFISPLLLGLVIGVLTQRQTLRGFLNRIGLNPVHSSPTAWDFAFSNRKGFSWVVVSLASGKRYHGVFGPSSLASSDLSRRDIFLEDIRGENFEPIEKDGRKRGVWLNENEIASIEIVEDKK